MRSSRYVSAPLVIFSCRIFVIIKVSSWVHLFACNMLSPHFASSSLVIMNSRGRLSRYPPSPTLSAPDLNMPDSLTWIGCIRKSHVISQEIYRLHSVFEQTTYIHTYIHNGRRHRAQLCPILLVSEASIKQEGWEMDRSVCSPSMK